MNDYGTYDAYMAEVTRIRIEEGLEMTPELNYELEEGFSNNLLPCDVIKDYMKHIGRLQ